MATSIYERRWEIVDCPLSVILMVHCFSRFGKL